MAEDAPAGTENKPPAMPPVVVKKYANRRLYNTESSSYITLESLAQMIRQGRDFVVYDAKSGEDITRSVLTQIIVEEEGKGHNLLPTGFLRQLIGFYGDQMQALVPRYLEQSMTAFAQQQEQIRAAMQRTMGNLFPFSNVTIEEVGRQNMAMIERALSLFTPFYRPPGAGPDKAAAEEIVALRAEVETLKRQLAEARTPPALAGGGKEEGAGPQPRSGRGRVAGARKQAEAVSPPEPPPQKHESTPDP
jgi:polyhydroxyalkanoate synthesis repressor PhaR